MVQKLYDVEVTDKNSISIQSVSEFMGKHVYSSTLEA